jgi:hypothetical protein
MKSPVALILAIFAVVVSITAAVGQARITVPGSIVIPGNRSAVADKVYCKVSVYDNISTSWKDYYSCNQPKSRAEAAVFIKKKK